MKNKKVNYFAILMIGISFTIILYSALALYQFRSKMERTRNTIGSSPIDRSTPVPPHTIREAKGLETKWILDNVYTDYDEYGPFMMTNEGRIVFLGSLERTGSYNVIILDAADGTVILRKGPVELGSTFSVDKSGIYIGRPGTGQIYKLNDQDGQTVWNQYLGFAKDPCCMSIVNGEVQSSWYPNKFYILSPQNGDIRSKLEDKGGRIFRVENGIFYANPVGGFTAEQIEGKKLWQLNIKEGVAHAPIFTKESIYLRTGDDVGSILRVDRKTGGIIWRSENNVLSNIALSTDRLYYLTSDGQLMGVDIDSGNIIVSARVAPDDFCTPSFFRVLYQVAYDFSTQSVLLIMGDSAQLFAFREAK